jgi:choice-of-anchor A domain-containing protein
MGNAPKRRFPDRGPSCGLWEHDAAPVTPVVVDDLDWFERWPRRWRFAILLSLLLSSLTGACAQHEQSLDAFVPAAHKTVFELYNLLVLGDLNLAKSSVEGPVAVSGNADVTEFEFNQASRCNKYKPAVVVKGAFHASMGAINNGYMIVGRSSKVKHNVRTSCSSRVESYNPVTQKLRSFEEHREGLIRESGDVCHNPTSGDVTVDEANKVMQLTPGNNTFSCYAVFKTSVTDLAKVTRLEYMGSDKDRNVLINIAGKSGTWRDFAMVGFNPDRTLVTFCGIRGHVELFNNRLHGSIFAPTTQFTVMGSVVNGSMITSDFRGKVALLYRPYVTC